MRDWIASQVGGMMRERHQRELARKTTSPELVAERIYDAIQNDIINYGPHAIVRVEHEYGTPHLTVICRDAQVYGITVEEVHL